MKYQDFLKTKTKTHIKSGFDVNENELNSSLFDFQKWIVKRALNSGKYGIFAGCGLGKTLMQLEWANQVSRHTDAPVLILTPLAVSGQTIMEGKKFDISISRLSETVDKGIYITNYEQLANIDCSKFSGIVLDESSIIKSHDGAYRNLLIESFSKTPYKLCCTATPSPNDPMELGNHAEFLDAMTRNEMLAMYFVHDGGQTSKWRIKGHAKESFYTWVGSWSVMLSHPSDIGFSTKGYDLPPLNFVEKTIITDTKQGRLFNDVAVSATNFNSELRLTKVERMDEVANIVNGSDENFIIWIKQNEEGELLKKLIPDAVEVKGADSPEYKEQKLLGFANNEFRVLITKTKIAQFGLNYQNCNNHVYASLDFSFEGLYQAIRRSYRFGQKKQVNAYIITTDTMQNVIQTIKIKEKQHEDMQNEMKKAINTNLKDSLSISEFDTKSVKNEKYEIKRGDCVQLIGQVPDESVGFSVFSPPFAELYTYSNHIEDMGNSKDYKEFLTQFGFLVKELFRVLKSGRNVAVHCMDLPIQKGKEGFIGLRDFSGMIISAFESEGFIYHSRVTIWKDPVIEMQRTKALGLLHKQIKKDSTMSRVGIPDYVLIFRKDGERKNPVKCDINVDTWQQYASPIWSFSDLSKEFEMIMPILSDDAYNSIPEDIRAKYAKPVWMDINYSNTLQGFRNARDTNDEKHICPLQLDTIERLIHLYSNKGDIVFTPFMGIGSEVYQAVKMGRTGLGFELKESYYELAKFNLSALCEIQKQLSIF